MKFLVRAYQHILFVLPMDHTPPALDHEEQKRTPGPNSSSFKIVPVVFEVGFAVATPLVILALLGRLADTYLETSPIFLIVGILLSIIISSIMVWRKMRHYLS